MTPFSFRIALLLIVLAVLLVGSLGTVLFIPLALLFIYTCSLLGMRLLGSQWVPTPDHVLASIVRELRLKKGMRMYDLGSGDGRVVAYFASHTPAQVVGIELDPLKVAWSWLRTARLPNAHIRCDNLFTADIRDADVVFLFMPQQTLDALQMRLKRLKKGTTIITYITECKNLTRIKQLKSRKVYIYRV